MLKREAHGPAEVRHITGEARLVRVKPPSRKRQKRRRSKAVTPGLGEISRYARKAGLRKVQIREPWRCAQCGKVGIIGAEAYERSGETGSDLLCVKCVAKATAVEFGPVRRLARATKKARGKKKMANARGVGILQPKRALKRVSSSTSSFRTHRPMKSRRGKGAS